MCPFKSLTIMLLLACGNSFAAGEIVLFRPRGTEPRQVVSRQGLKTATVVEYEMEVQAEAVTADQVRVGSWLVFEPEPGVVMTAAVDRVSVDVNNTTTIRARIVGRPDGLLLLTMADGQVFATIDLPVESRHYLVRFDGERQKYYSEPAKSGERDVLEGGPALIPPPAPVSRRSLLISSGGDPLPSSSARIDVMIIYTPAARSYAGGTTAMNNIIAQAMERGQTALDNSAIPVTLRLVHAAEVTYTESGSSNTDLNRLTSTSDGYMDIVHTWRDAYGADLVGLFTEVEDTGGVGWLLSTTNGSPAYAFAITRVQQASFTYTTIHEMGHNMGCHHRTNQVTQPGPGLYSYSAGWRWVGTNTGKYASVMSYEEDGYSRVAYFSSPDVSYMGVATGTATDDNARGIRNIMNVIANYRAPVYGTFWVRAIALTNSVVLRWMDPLEYGVANQTVHIRHDTSDYPASTNAGSLTYQGTNQVYEHTGLTPDQPYYYSAFVSEDGTNFFEPE